MAIKYGKLVFPGRRGNVQSVIPDMTKTSTKDSVIFDCVTADGETYNVDNLTITGRIRNVITGTENAIGGTLTGSGTQITWTPTAGDVGTAGRYSFWVIGTSGGDPIVSLPSVMTVVDVAGEADVAAEGFANIPTSEATWLTSQKGAINGVTDGNIIQADGAGNLEDSTVPVANIATNATNITSVTNEVNTAQGNYDALGDRVDAIDSAPGTARLGEAITATDTGEKTLRNAVDTVYAGSYAVLSAGTNVAELVKIGATGGVEPSGASFARSHSIDAIVTPIVGDAIDARLYAIDPSQTAANNATRLQRLVNDAAGLFKIVLGPGTHSYDTTLEIPDGGLHLRGSGSGDDGTPSTLNYTGSAQAIKQAAGFSTGHNKITIYKVRLTGTASATGGIDLTGGSTYVDTDALYGLYVSGFTGASAYGINISNAYNLVARGCVVIDCSNGIQLTGVHVNTLIADSWVKGAVVNYGIHCNISSGSAFIERCIIDSSSQPITQVGLYAQSGQCFARDIHFEDLYKPYQIDSGQSEIHAVNLGSYTAAPTIADDIIVDIPKGSAMPLTPAGWVQAGLGTRWDVTTGGVIAPLVTNPTSGILTSWSPQIRLSSTSAWDLQGFNGDAGRESGNTLTLIFEDSDITVKHAGTGDYEFYLRGDSDWTPGAGSVLFLTKIIDDTSSPWQWYEVGRYDVTLYGKNLTADYTIEESDGGKLLGNGGASSTVTLTLPNVTAVPVGWNVTVCRAENQTLRVDPFSTNRIRGAGVGTGAAGKYIDVPNGAAIKLVNYRQDTYWEIVAYTGSPTYEP